MKSKNGSSPNNSLTIKVAYIILNNVDILILAPSIYIFYDCFFFVYLQAKLKHTILNLVIPYLILVYYY